MPVFVSVITVVAVVAIVVVIVLARRLDSSQRVIRSVSHALGTAATDADLLRAARTIAADADAARLRANSYSAALQGANTGVAMLAANGAVQYANPAAQLLLEGPREKAVLRTRVTALGQRVHASGEIETVEVDIHDPERKVLSLTAVPVDIEGGGLGTVCLYLEDLSARRRLDAMRTDFVANASHELKTPLGALALLAETLSEAEDEEMRLRLAERLRIEATRMANVIDDVLQLAETESLGAEYVHVSIGDVLEESVKAVESAALDGGITMIPDEVIDATVAGDREQLISAVTNLMRNAITYTAVKEEPGFVRYRSRVDDGRVHIEIEDTGIGIPARYTDRVFERFFRVDRARSRESGGTGLGLSIVRNVALAHGGDVGLRSSVGVGSTFTISLPVITEGST